jgi:hypothetical protein
MFTLGLPMGYGSKTGLPLDVEGLMQVLASSTGPSDPDKAHTFLDTTIRGRDGNWLERTVQGLKNEIAE